MVVFEVRVVDLPHCVDVFGPHLLCRLATVSHQELIEIPVYVHTHSGVSHQELIEIPVYVHTHSGVSHQGGYTYHLDTLND